MTFYAYLWMRANGTPYYAGKGKGNRAFRSVEGHRPPTDRNRIVIFDRASEQDAVATERELIRNWGRRDLRTGCLHNRTDGGEGTSGRKDSMATRLKKSIANQGQKRTPETIARMAAIRPSAETRAKQSCAKLGNTINNGRTHSAERRAIESVAHIGKPWSAARRAAQERRNKK